MRDHSTSCFQNCDEKTKDYNLRGTHMLTLKKAGLERQPMDYTLLILSDVCKVSIRLISFLKQFLSCLVCVHFFPVLEILIFSLEDISYSYTKIWV